MLNPRPFPALTWLVFALLVSACKEKIDIDNNDNNYPVALRAELLDDVIRFSWDVAQVSDFEKYVLVRSTDSIPAGLNPLNSQSQQIVFEADHRDIVAFDDVHLPVEPQLFYKLYVSIGDRFVESANLRFAFDHFFIAGNLIDLHFIADSNWVLLANGTTQNFQLVDYEKNKLVNAQTNAIFNSWGQMIWTTGKYNNNPEVYWWGNDSGFSVFDLPGLTLVQNKYFPILEINAIATNNDGLIFASQNDFTNGFATYHRDNLSLLKGHYRDNYGYLRPLLVLDPQTNLVLETGGGKMRIFNVNGTTGDLENFREAQVFSSQVFDDIPASADRRYFVPFSNGFVYDQDFNVVAAIPEPGNNGPDDVSFSPDGQYIYVADRSFITPFGTRIRKYHLPSMELSEVRFIPDLFEPRILAKGNSVVVVGTKQNNGISGNLIAIKKLNF